VGLVQLGLGLVGPVEQVGQLEDLELPVGPVEDLEPGLQGLPQELHTHPINHK
jgi:hypothetical protein